VFCRRRRATSSGCANCADKYGILLVFDEVITGFGRLGHTFAAERFGVVPDMITFAKGVTSGTIPMGGVMVRDHIYNEFMGGPEHVIELFHGYTYTGHPMAAAAALATLDVYRDEQLYENVLKLEDRWADAAMSLKGHPLVEDIRTLGLVAANRHEVGGRTAGPACLQGHGKRLPRPRHRACALPAIPSRCHRP
jgi:adenosylmethionine-8-amino-7-oxononanoate aminotransferase